MPTRNLAIALALSLLPMASAGPALADRAPTAQERTQIEAALRDAGYTAWEEIEFDDGKWEVDDAIAADGQEYDLYLDKSFKIIKRERDD